MPSRYCARRAKPGSRSAWTCSTRPTTRPH
jgi:hypothetical protein